MKVRIQTQGFNLTPAIAAAVNRRLDGMMSRFAEDIMSVDVYLKDLNGPKGGYDKQAIIRVHLRHRSSLGITTTHNDLYKAINVCARRCARSVRRTIGRKRLVRQRGQQVLAAAFGPQ